MTSDRSEPNGSGNDDANVDDPVIDDPVIDDAVIDDAVIEETEPAATLAPRPTESGLWAAGLSGPASSPGITLPAPDYSEAGVPSLDYVRDKIEGRYANSLGSTELAHETPEARSFEEQAAKREEAAKEKLEAIRRSLRGDSS